MEHLSLQQLIERLKSSPRVRGVFVTGSTAANSKPWSDVDLVIILDTNTVGLKSIYTMVENRFADIFFFDKKFVQDIISAKDVSGLDMRGMFVTWLTKAKIEYDPDGILENTQAKFKKDPPMLSVTEQEQRDLWVKINYNFIANNRYFKAQDPVYQQALAIRLSYSVVELMTAYFSLRGIPWRGEKAAVEYFQQHDPEYLGAFVVYSSVTSIESKMESYGQLFEKTLYGGYQKWDDNFIIPVSSDHAFSPNLVEFWQELLGRSSR